MSSLENNYLLNMLSCQVSVESPILSRSTATMQSCTYVANSHRNHTAVVVDCRAP